MGEGSEEWIEPETKEGGKEEMAEGEDAGGSLSFCDIPVSGRV